MAWYEDRACRYTVIHKLEGELFSGLMKHRSFDSFGVIDYLSAIHKSLCRCTVIQSWEGALFSGLN